MVTEAMKFKIAILLLSSVLIGEQFTRARSGAITIYLAGDSTMAQKLPGKRPETGWGEMLGKFFRDGKVIIENHAQNGRSTRTPKGSGRRLSISCERAITFLSSSDTTTNRRRRSIATHRRPIIEIA